MDNYTLSEVKMLIDKKMLKPEILNNILKSTTRRIELYDDKDDLEILKYLSNNNSIPKATKEEINKYLSEYENYNVDKNNDFIEKKSLINKKVIMVTLVLLLILILMFLLIIQNSGV